MCFDCLLAFPPFGPSASAGVKKSLIKVSRSRSTSPKPQSEDHYGPPLKHDLNQEDLPEENVTKLGTAAVDDGDSGTYNTHETESETSMSMDPSTGIVHRPVALCTSNNGRTVAQFGKSTQLRKYSKLRKTRPIFKRSFLLLMKEGV